MKPIIALALAVSIEPVSAHAQDLTDAIPIVRMLPDGGLEHTGEFEYAKNFAGGIWDKAGPPTAILMQNGRQTPIVTQKDISFLDTQFGGSGEIELEFTEVQPIDLDTVGEPHAPIELFEDDGSDPIAPLDGTWKSHLSVAGEAGCPPGTSAALLSVMGTSDTRDIRFSTPQWSPSDFGAEFAEMEWEKIGTNTFFATPYSAPPEAQTAGMDLVVHFQMRASSETHIDVGARIIVTFSQMLAQMAGSGQVCEIEARGDYTRQ